jgi:hypothetical protein
MGKELYVGNLSLADRVFLIHVRERPYYGLAAGRTGPERQHPRDADAV